MWRMAKEKQSREKEPNKQEECSADGFAICVNRSARKASRSDLPKKTP